MFKPVEETDSTRFYELGEIRIGLLKGNGYVNATAICKACDKRVNNYLRTQETIAFLMETAEQEGVSMEDLIITRKGGDDEQGTWVHPIVAINLAQWASPSFAYSVSKWIIDWFNGSRNPSPVSDALYGASDVLKSAPGSQQVFEPSVEHSMSDTLEGEDELDMIETIAFFTKTYRKLLKGAQVEQLLPDVEQRRFASLRRKVMQMSERQMRNLS